MKFCEEITLALSSSPSVIALARIGTAERRAGATGFTRPKGAFPTSPFTVASLPRTPLRTTARCFIVTPREKSAASVMSAVTFLAPICGATPRGAPVAEAIATAIIAANVSFFTFMRLKKFMLMYLCPPAKIALFSFPTHFATHKSLLALKFISFCCHFHPYPHPIFNLH